MGLKAECDLCKDSILDEQDILEIKLYPSTGGPPSKAFGAMICLECQQALGLKDFLHKFQSMGAVDLVKQAMEQAAAQRARENPMVQPVAGNVIPGPGGRGGRR